MEKVSEIFAKFFDNLNAGRIIFYIASGCPATAILFMTGHTLIADYTPIPETSRQLIKKIIREDIAFISNHVLQFIIISYIVGFLISLACYPSLSKLQCFYSKGYSITQNIKVLYGEKDYLNTLLIPEYYRYVEAVFYIPIGILLGVYGFVLYAIINIVSKSNSWGETFLISIAIAVISQLLFLIWYKKVIRAIVRLYEESKADIISSLGGFKDE